MLPTTLLAHPAVSPPAKRRVRRTPHPARLVRVAAPRHPLRAIGLALVLLALTGLGYLQAWPPLATVMSASMAPTINTGDMVVLKRLNGPVRPGDIAVIPVPDDARSRYGYPPVVIHRVMSIAADGQVTTKGDARPEADPFKVPSSALTSKVIAHVPAGGRALAFLSSGPGLLWLISGGVLLLGMPLLDRQRDGRRREEEASADLHAQLASLSEALEDLRVERLKEQLALQRRLEAAQRETAAVQERLLA